MHHNLKIIYFSIGLCYSLLSYGNSVNITSKNGSIKDSLEHISFDELWDKYYYFYNENDTENCRLVAKAYLNKSKKSNDLSKRAEGYFLQSYVQFDDNKIEDAFKYSDSAIALSTKFESKYFPAWGYMQKGYYYNWEDNDKKAVEYYLKAYKDAEAKDNKFQIVEILIFMGAIKGNNSNLHDALKFEKEAIKYIRNHNLESVHEYDYCLLLINISNTYLDLGKLDSAKYFLDKGYSEIRSRDQVYLRDLIKVFYSEYLLQIKKYEESLDTLSTVKNFHLTNLIDYYYLKGANEYYLKNYSESETNLLKMDSICIENPTEFYLSTLKGYKLLVELFKKQDNTQKQLHFIEKFLKYDSILQSKKEEVDNAIYHKYDVPNLLADKEQVIDRLESVKNQNRNTIIVLIMISIAVVLYYRNRSKKLKQKVDEALRNASKVVNSIKAKKEEKTTTLPQSIIEYITAELHDFEANQAYRDPSISIQSLAKKFKTNANYLSQVVNHTKGMSFSTYLNELRVNCATKKLINDPMIRKYSIEAIAKECGFNTAQSFSKYFKKKNGINPSFFIKKLESS